jgi:hypothetical protein
MSGREALGRFQIAPTHLDPPTDHWRDHTETGWRLGSWDYVPALAQEHVLMVDLIAPSIT